MYSKNWWLKTHWRAIECLKNFRLKLLIMQSICPIVSHLLMFGNIAYPHVLDQERSKLNNKSKNYVFICYDPSSNGYKLKNLNIGKLIVNRDVEFNEEGIWDWSTQEEEKYDFFPLLEEEEHWIKFNKSLTLHLNHQNLPFLKFHPLNYH